MLEKQQPTYVELFCGCGGMSLGLESAGFKRILANEISPMAAETFAFNLVKGARAAASPLLPSSPGTWDPYFTFLDVPVAGLDGSISDPEFRDWRRRGKSREHFSPKAIDAAYGASTSDLIVGDVGRLRDLLKELATQDPTRFERRFGDIDLLAGGPPCQSFSLAGKRQRDHPRNRLFHSFVDIAATLKPRVILFENVVGITKPFRDEEGKEWHPWYEVCRAFRKAGYIPIPSLINAVNFGIPQSRPRFIMIAIAEHIAEKVKGSELDRGGLSEALRRGAEEYSEECQWTDGDDRRLIFRPEIDFESEGWPKSIFPLPYPSSVVVSVGEAIGDLLEVGRGLPFNQGEYSRKLNKKLKRPDWIKSPSEPINHGLRRHGDHTRARFRLLRRLAQEGMWAKSMAEVTKREDEVVAKLINKPLLVPGYDGGYVETKRASEAQIWRLISELKSAKNVQKCLKPSRPAGAQLSIPDDSIHWAEDRVLTIREMARIQSFPDWFEFRSKETTGGSSRAYEVPQYTQVGNAVPPLLALEFGKAIRKFLSIVEQLG